MDDVEIVELVAMAIDENNPVMSTTYQPHGSISWEYVSEAMCEKCRSEARVILAALRAAGWVKLVDGEFVGRIRKVEPSGIIIEEPSNG